MRIVELIDLLVSFTNRYGNELATQEDVLDIISRLLFNIFDNFKSHEKSINTLPFL